MSDTMHEQPLSYSVLVDLLRNDLQLQALIRDLATVTPATPSAEIEPLREELAPQLELLRLLQDDPTLAPGWLDETAPLGYQLVRLIAIAAHWGRILELWDHLAARCRQSRQAADASVLQLLDGCLAIHNLIWDTRQARLVPVEIGCSFDYRLHQRTTPTGETIMALWLPGLANAGGEIQRQPLVST